MVFRNFIIITLLAFASPLLSLAQGKIIYLNGKEKRFETAEVRGEYIVYQPEGSTKEWSRKSDRYNVFSLQRDNGTEEIIYAPDTSEGGDPSVEEVRDYIKGERFAMQVYSKPLNFGAGLYVGVGSSLAGFYGIPVPLVYSTILGLRNPKVPKELRGENYSEAFVAGYQKKSRNIKIKKSLLGGGIGFSVGVAWFIILSNNAR